MCVSFFQHPLLHRCSESRRPATLLGGFFPRSVNFRVQIHKRLLHFLVQRQVLIGLRLQTFKAPIDHVLRQLWCHGVILTNLHGEQGCDAVPDVRDGGLNLRFIILRRLGGALALGALAGARGHNRSLIAASQASFLLAAQRGGAGIPPLQPAPG